FSSPLFYPPTARTPRPPLFPTRRSSDLSAVSCEERHTSSACCSGESSRPNEAWMPPCAFDELFACREPLVASATLAPARSADTPDRKSTRLNSSHRTLSYAVFCLQQKI